MAEPVTTETVGRSGTGMDAQTVVQAHSTADNLNARGADGPTIEADSADGDSAYGVSTTSSFLTSIASEVTRGLFENGRRYSARLSYSNTRTYILAGITPLATPNMLFRTMKQKVCLRAQGAHHDADILERIV